MLFVTQSTEFPKEHWNIFFFLIVLFILLLIVFPFARIKNICCLKERLWFGCKLRDWHVLNSKRKPSISSQEGSFSPLKVDLHPPTSIDLLLIFNERNFHVSVICGIYVFIILMKICADTWENSCICKNKHDYSACALKIDCVFHFHRRNNLCIYKG